MKIRILTCLRVLITNIIFKFSHFLILIHFKNEFIIIFFLKKRPPKNILHLTKPIEYSKLTIYWTLRFSELIPINQIQFSIEILTWFSELLDILNQFPFTRGSLNRELTAFLIYWRKMMLIFIINFFNLENSFYYYKDGFFRFLDYSERYFGDASCSRDENRWIRSVLRFFGWNTWKEISKNEDVESLIRSYRIV